MKKHLVYAEDMMYEIMQYPSRDLSKKLIRHCTAEAIKNNEVTIWQHVRYCIKGWFKR